MKLFFLLASISGVLSAAVSPEQLGSWQPDEDPGHLSLPNLLNVEKISDLDLTWARSGNVRLDTGRLLFDNKGPGSVWSIAGLENSGREWTVEVVFRSTGATRNQDFSSGLSFWLLNEQSFDTLIGPNYGGPEIFDGFQFLLNNKGQEGIKVFSGDGSHKVETELGQSIGNCLFGFQDSQIPFTLRISYSKDKKLFKVQVDNNLCFKTNQIMIPTDGGDFKFGFSANVDPRSHEVYELFKINVWPYMTQDAIDDHGILSDGSKMVVYKTVTSQEAQKTDTAYVRPGVVRESLMAKSQKQREEIIRQFKAEQNGDNTHINELHNKIHEQLQQHNSDLGSSISSLTESIIGLKQDLQQLDQTSKIFEVQQVQKQHSDVLNQLLKSVDTLKSEMSSQNAQLLSTITKLHEKAIGEVRDYKFELVSVGEKVDLLMSHHREIQKKYDQQASNFDEKKGDVANTISFITRWILIPIVIGIIVIFVIVSRLRHDIKHSKLL